MRRTYSSALSLSFKSGFNTVSSNNASSILPISLLSTPSSIRSLPFTFSSLRLRGVPSLLTACQASRTLFSSGFRPQDASASISLMLQTSYITSLFTTANLRSLLNDVSPFKSTICLRMIFTVLCLSALENFSLASSLPASSAPISS